MDHDKSVVANCINCLCILNNIENKKKNIQSAFYLSLVHMPKDIESFYPKCDMLNKRKALKYIACLPSFINMFPAFALYKVYFDSKLSQSFVVSRKIPIIFLWI